MEQNVTIWRKLDHIESITETLEKKGYAYEYRVLRQEVIEANKFLSDKLQIPLACKVFAYQKLRIVEGQPKTLEKVYLDYHKVNGIVKMDLTNQSLYRILKKHYGHQVPRN